MRSPSVWDIFDEKGPAYEDKINDLFSALQTLQKNASPTLQSFGTGDDRDDIARYGLCLMLEAAELINALPWKRWARNPPDMNHAVEEFADMLCFLGSIVGLFKRLGFNESVLTAAYVKKIAENEERFAQYELDEASKTEGT